jgi:pimeloyl-ACP methyl ester carboxylesterase
MIASIDDTHLFDRLAESGARLISIARPGYGGSSPYEMVSIGEWGEIVSTLVDRLGLAEFDVFGISSGAPYAYAVASRLPGRVRALYILSGIPALYDDAVRAGWPFPLDPQATLAEMRQVAREVFFADLTPTDRERSDIKDSLANDCFGVAQDLRLRCRDWGFDLREVTTPVIMRHSQTDLPALTVRTASLLPHCRLDLRENDPHFSQEVLDDFIRTEMAGAGGI